MRVRVQVSSCSHKGRHTNYIFMLALRIFIQVSKQYIVYLLEDILDKDFVLIRKTYIRNLNHLFKNCRPILTDFHHKLRRRGNSCVEDIDKSGKDTTEKDCIAQSAKHINICRPLQKSPHSTIRLGERCNVSASQSPPMLPMALTKASLRIVFSEIQHQDKACSSEFHHETRFPSTR